MKKITLLFLLLLSVFSYGQQTCNQAFTYITDYDVNPTGVLTINYSDFNCYSGTPNAITITNAILSSNSSYDDVDCVNGMAAYELNLDGVISRVCPNDLIGMVITNFNTLTISTDQSHGSISNSVIAIVLTADYASSNIPSCDSVMTTPINGSDTASIGGQTLAWSPTPDTTGYHVKVGTTSNGTEILDVDLSSNILNNYSLTLPDLSFDTQYYVNIIPYNQNGSASNCIEYTFSTEKIPIESGQICTNPINITALPYTTTDNSSNYAYNYYTFTPQPDEVSGCGAPLWDWSASYEVVYAYTATFSGSINVHLNGGSPVKGVYAYASCADIAHNCIGGAIGDITVTEYADLFLPVSINNLSVTLGQTYYFVVVTDFFQELVTTDYTLTIVANTCTNPVANFNVFSASDCSTSQQFFVTVDITSLGSATSVIVSDNQGSTPQTVSTTGVVTFGPYSNNVVSPIMTVTNSDDSNCFVSSFQLIHGNCVPDCAEATVLECGTEITVDFPAGAGSTSMPIGDYGIYFWDIQGASKLFSFTPTVTGMYYMQVLNGNSYVWALVKEAIGSCLSDYQLYLNWNEQPGEPFVFTNDGAIYPWQPLQAGTTYWLLLTNVATYGNPTLTNASTAVFRINCSTEPVVCQPAIISSPTLVSNCPDQTFNLNVELLDKGSATAFTVTDDQGSPSQTISDLGNVVFGPYPNGVFPIITFTDVLDPNCNVSTYGQDTQYICPGQNDICSNAILLTCDVVTGGGSYITQTTENATLSETASCANIQGNDVWFKFIGSGTQETIYAGSQDDTIHLLEIYESSGGCAGFTLGSCFKNAVSVYDPLNEFGFAKVSFLSTSGTEYYVRVGHNDTSEIHNFYVTLFCGGGTPPINDDLCNAIELFVGNPSAGDAYTNVDGSNQAGEPSPTCFDGGATSTVWFKFVAPASGNVKVTTDIIGGSLRDTEIAVFDGMGVNCSNLTTLGSSIGCDQDGGVEVFFNSTLNLSSLTQGATYYIQVDRWGGSGIPENGTFGIEVIDMGELATSNIDNQGFLVYPNPVKNILNLSYNNSIEKVLVYNLLGQEVGAKSNADNTQIDMSNLASGTYLVKISSGDKVKIMKVIKE